MPKLSEEREIVLTLSMEEDETGSARQRAEATVEEGCDCRLTGLLHKFGHDLDLLLSRSAGQVEGAKYKRLA